MKGVCEERDGYGLYSSASVSIYYEKLSVLCQSVILHAVAYKISHERTDHEQ